MRQIIILIMSIIAFALSARSAHILVWHFNPGEYDYYEDPEANDTIDCAYWIKKSLTAIRLIIIP